MKKVYLKDKAELLERNKAYQTEMFTEERISHLPEPLKKYLRVCGYMNTPVPHSRQASRKNDLLSLTIINSQFTIDN